MGYLGIAILVLVGSAWAIGRKRSVQLKQKAHLWGFAYRAQLEQVLTESQRAASYFFRQGKHRFNHVLTRSETAAFLRICDDQIMGLSPNLAPVTYTLMTAELAQGKFTPLVLMPRRTQETVPSGSLPADLAQKYVLAAPAGYAFSPTMIAFLQASPLCYLELTPYALIYHEFDIKPVEQLQPLRYRVEQLIAGLVQRELTPTPSEIPAALEGAAAISAKATPTAEQLQAQVLLKLQTASRPALPNSARWVYAVLLIGLLSGMLLFAGYLLKYGIAQ